MGVDRVVAVDLHCGQIQGFFGPRVPVDNLDGGTVGVSYFGDKDLHNPGREGGRQTTTHPGIHITCHHASSILHTYLCRHASSACAGLVLTAGCLSPLSQ